MNIGKEAVSVKFCKYSGNNKKNCYIAILNDMINNHVKIKILEKKSHKIIEILIKYQHTNLYTSTTDTRNMKYKKIIIK